MKAGGKSPVGRTERLRIASPCLVVLLVLFALLSGARAQDADDAPPERPVKPPVILDFTPPDLEGQIVLGIFDQAGKLQRTLRFEPGAPELIIDTNGYIVKWDGRDEAGKPCPGGRYSARGFVVGNEVSIEGVDFHFNDWMAQDQIPAQDVRLRQWPDGIGVELTTPHGPVYERIQPDGKLSAVADPMDWASSGTTAPKLKVPPIGWSPGRDGTTWAIVDDGGQHVVAQFGKDGTSLRELRVPAGDPQPVEILASPADDVILLRETGPGGIQRVRLLKRGKAETQAGGKVIANWEVVFDRSLQPCANFGVVDGKLVADAGSQPEGTLITVPLIENALEPGKKTQLRMSVVPTHPGSAWALEAGGAKASSSAPVLGSENMDGLELIKISAEGDWNRFRLGGPAAESGFTLYQGDGIVVEEFLVKNLDHLAAFDAGSFLLAPPAQ